MSVNVLAADFVDITITSGGLTLPGSDVQSRFGCNLIDSLKILSKESIDHLDEHSFSPTQVFSFGRKCQKALNNGTEESAPIQKVCKMCRRFANVLKYSMCIA